jgi:hypothetical protein
MLAFLIYIVQLRRSKEYNKNTMTREEWEKERTKCEYYVPMESIVNEYNPKCNHGDNSLHYCMTWKICPRKEDE